MRSRPAARRCPSQRAGARFHHRGFPVLRAPFAPANLWVSLHRAIEALRPLLRSRPALAFALTMFCSIADAASHAPVAGVRAGFGASSGTDGFRQAEFVLRLPLATSFDLGEEWRALAAADLSLGRLEERDTHAAIGAVGAVLILARDKLPLSIELGVAPTLLSRHEFSRDFGQALQFTSHAGVLLQLGDFRIGYRFQHMSNARLADPNPGLNQHLFSIFLRL